MNLGKKNKKQALRSRRPSSSGSGEPFRRNAVVISRTQREIEARQRSVTDRQVEYKKRQRRHHQRNLVIVVVVFCVAIFLLMRFSVGTIRIESDPPFRLSPSQQSQYATIVNQQIDSHTFMHQSWLLDTDKLTHDIIAKHPEIENITFSSHAPFSTRLSAHITFRKPIFVWKDSVNQTQFVDKNGVLFSKNLDGTTKLDALIHIEDQSGVVLDPGTSVLTNDVVQFIGRLHTLLPPLYHNAGIQQIIIPRSTREVDVQVVGQPYLIKFTVERSVEEQVGDLTVLLGYMQVKGITPASYIDIRIAHKAFYK